MHMVAATRRRPMTGHGVKSPWTKDTDGALPMASDEGGRLEAFDAVLSIRDGTL